MKLPRVHASHGRWFYVRDLEARRASGRPRQTWIPLTRVDAGAPALLAALAALLGAPARPEGTIKAHLDEFRQVHLPGLGVGSRKEYARMYDIIAEAFSAFDSPDVQPGDVVKFLADNFAGKPNTRGKYKARLSTFFSWCVLNSHTGVTVNPCREIRLSSPPKRRGRMDNAIYWTLFDALSPMGRCFLELTYLTRQRPTEIRLLRESQIGGDRIRFVPTKTEASSGEEVEVLITLEIRACLERARALRTARKVEQLERRRDPFLIQTRGGDGYSKNGLYKIWRDACAAAGVKGVTTRDIRPFAGAMMKKLGYSTEDVQLSYAHASIATTEAYLAQHRDRFSHARLPLPARPK